MELDEMAKVVKSELSRVSADVDRFIAAQKGRVAELSEKQGELQARLLEVEQKQVRSGGGDPGGGHGNHALRALLEGSAELKAVAERRGRRAVIEMPPGYFNSPIRAQITSTGITMSDQRSEIAAPAQRRLTIRQLIPSVPTSGGSIQYLQETAFTNNAAPVSETNTKPESNLTFELETAAVVVLAHWIRISTQAISDVPQMVRYIDGRLRYGLAYVEELQLLKGSGVGNNLTGLYTAATNFSGSGGTRIDRLRMAIEQLALADFSASGIVIHPSDWRAIALLKDTTGRYIVGDPSGANPPTLWNLPVIPTAAMTVDTFLVGDFQQAALIFDREQARVDISTETEDDFVTNRAHVRAEERLGLGILRPGALVKGDLSGS